MKPYRFERAFDKFEIIDVTSSEGLDSLVSAIVAEPLHAVSPAGFALIDTIVRSGRCKTIIMEKEYVDGDYRRAYQRYYARAFPNYERHTTRLHFLGVKVTRRGLANLEAGKVGGEYLGYCVVRPLRTRKVGRTVLQPLLAAPEADFPLALSEFEVNVCGSRLVVSGAPFLEQDTRVGCCGSCAIWMSTMVAGRKFGLPTSTVAEITELATDYALGERVLGSTGLSWEEMEGALRKMGYNPLSLGIASRESAMQIIHPYLEAGIAPILLLELKGGLHAAVAVGHGYDPSQAAGEQAKVQWEGREIRFWRSSQWINYLLVHDDQRGPFRKMYVANASSGRGKKQHCSVEIDMQWPAFEGNAGWPVSAKGRLHAALIPVPPGISMTGVEAEEKAARLTDMVFGSVLGRGMPSNIVLRTYLTRSNDYKRFARERGLVRKVRDLFRGKPLARWIWVTELCTVRDATVSKREDRIVRGEVILDGNSSPWTPDFVAIHLIAGDVGYLALMKPEDTDAESAITGGLVYARAGPYKALVR